MAVSDLIGPGIGSFSTAPFIVTRGLSSNVTPEQPIIGAGIHLKAPPRYTYFRTPPRYTLFTARCRRAGMPVTVLETRYKQPSESLVYTFDFTALLETGETLSSATVTATPIEGLDTDAIVIGTPAVNSSAITPLGAPSAIAIGKAVQVRISAGTDGTLYRLECTAPTSSSNTREVDAKVRVTDDGEWEA